MFGGMTNWAGKRTPFHCNAYLFIDVMLVYGLVVFVVVPDIPIFIIFLGNNPQSVRIRTDHLMAFRLDGKPYRMSTFVDNGKTNEIYKYKTES